MVLTAVCIFMGQLMGTIILQQQDSSSMLHVTGNVSGLKPGDHGFHIHQYGDLRNNCTNAGGHFNPYGKQHGGPTDPNRHVGDFGNIVADSDGLATIDAQFGEAQLDGNFNISVIGKAIVVHADRDDLGKGGFPDSLTTGHAGARLDCCVIGLTKPSD